MSCTSDIRGLLRRLRLPYLDEDLSVLVDCCLLRIDTRDGSISMHDQMHDLAIAIVMDHFLQAGPSVKRARVHSDDAAAVLQEAMKKVCCI